MPLGVPYTLSLCVPYCNPYELLVPITTLSCMLPSTPGLLPSGDWKSCCSEEKRFTEQRVTCQASEAYVAGNKDGVSPLCPIFDLI